MTLVYSIFAYIIMIFGVFAAMWWALGGSVESLAAGAYSLGTSAFILRQIDHLKGGSQ